MTREHTRKFLVTAMRGSLGVHMVPCLSGSQSLCRQPQGNAGWARGAVVVVAAGRGGFLVGCECGNAFPSVGRSPRRERLCGRVCPGSGLCSASGQHCHMSAAPRRSEGWGQWTSHTSTASPFQVSKCLVPSTCIIFPINFLFQDAIPPPLPNTFIFRESY